MLITLKLAKGLEFDHVIVPDASARAFPGEDDLAPVSYTHLDVYKRQVLRHESAPRHRPGHEQRIQPVVVEPFAHVAPRCHDGKRLAGRELSEHCLLYTSRKKVMPFRKNSLS